jgi:hypothetical protein
LRQFFWHWQRRSTNGTVQIAHKANTASLPMNGQGDPHVRRDARLPVGPRLIIAIAVFLAVWGAKLTVIDAFGSDLPFWDQWAKEGEQLYAPWLDRGEVWRNLFVPHNEHRIAPTLLLNFGLMQASGQWDARVQCVVSAGLHAALLTGIFLWSARRLSCRWAHFAAVMLVAVGAAPIAGENILGGFQSQFYFLIGFSILAMGGLLLNRALSFWWWAGVVAGTAALVSMGSGFLWTIPVILISALRLWRRESQWSACTSLLTAVLIACLGGWLHTAVPAHQPFHAQSVAAFFLYAARCLSWPWMDRAWLGPILWFPWLALCATQLFNTVRSKWSIERTSDEATPAAVFITATGLWVLLQIAAVSYARGGGGEVPPSRYGDVASIGVMMSFCALALLKMRFDISPVIVGTWSGTVAVSLLLATHHLLHMALPNKKADNVAYERNVQQFILSDDIRVLEKKSVPFPNSDWLARVLRHQRVGAILPVSVRRPLPIVGLENGAPPDLPPLTNRVTRSVLGPGEWRSEVLPRGSGWWKIETCGHLAKEGASLSIRSAKDGGVLATIAPSKSALSHWRAAYVRAPAEPAVLVARTDSANHWFAFSEPVEMSALSHAVWLGGKYGIFVSCGGVLLGLGTIAASFHKFFHAVGSPHNSLSDNLTFRDTHGRV